jgi:NitT/TauT family transport system permease protein
MNAPVRALLSLVGFVVLWWGAVWGFNVPAFLLPSPEAVASRIVFLVLNAGLWGHAATTLGQILVGFLVGALLGIGVGAIFARMPRLERLATPLILLVQTAPKIAIAPLLILWLGLGPGPKIVLVAIVTFFPAMTGALTGLRYVGKAYRDLATVVRLTPWQRLTRIELPFAVPPIVAGLRVATTQAVTAAVVAEMMGANRGLGYLLTAGQESSDSPTVIGVIILLSLAGWGFYEIVRWAEGRIAPWQAAASRR